jgi:hypothetical protein
MNIANALKDLVGAAGATQLTLAAFVSIAAAGICYRFFRTAPVWARMASFFAILLFAFAICLIVLGPKKEVIDPGKLITLLRALPENQRMVTCELLKTASECSQYVDALAGLQPPPSTPAFKEAVAKAIESGQVAPAVVAQVDSSVRRQGDQIVALGDPRGYDIDFFWCAPSKNASRARVLANRLAASKSIAAGAPIGRVRVRSMSSAVKSSATYREHSTTVGAELTELQIGERVAALLNVYEGGGDSFSVLQTGYTPTPYYLSVFVCPRE